MKTLVLGAGKMVSAILEGLTHQIDLTDFYIYSPSGVSAKQLAKKVGANWLTDIGQVKDFEYVWIGCKPQQLQSVSALVLPELKNAIFVSFLAAISEKVQMEYLGVTKLIRVMPNLNVRIKKGISLASSLSNPASLPQLENIFKKLGHFIILSEEELDDLTLLSGSGPALIYEFAKNLSDSFSSLNENDREKLVKSLLVGSAEVASNSQKSFMELSSEVTSKGGVTIAVLNYWRDHGFNNLIQAGVKNGKLRSLEITKSFNQV